jgi:hypothetical protein
MNSKDYEGDPIKEFEMVTAYSTYEREQKNIHYFG